MSVTLSLGSARPKIEKASCEWIAMFGMDAQACYGRTLAIVQGPETDQRELNRILQAAQHGKAAQTRLVLYSGAGSGALFSVSARPSCSFEHCEMTMSRVDALTHEAAVAEDGAAKVLVASQKPFKVSHVSRAFSKAYGIKQEHLLNRTLAMIQGPNTHGRALAELFDAALQGLTQAAHIQTYTRNGTEVGRDLTYVRVVPVMSAGDMSHLLVVMGAAPRADFFPAPCDFEERNDKATRADSSSELSPYNEVSPVGQESHGAPFASCSQVRDRGTDRTVDLVIQRLHEYKTRHQTRPMATVTLDKATVTSDSTRAAAPPTLSEASPIQGKARHAHARQERRVQRRPSVSFSESVTVLTSLRSTSSPTTASSVLREPSPEPFSPFSSLALLVCVFVKIIMSLATFGALPMPAIRPDRRQDQVRGKEKASARAGRRMLSARHEWQMIHHLEMSDSMLGGFTVY